MSTKIAALHFSADFSAGSAPFPSRRPFPFSPPHRCAYRCSAWSLHRNDREIPESVEYSLPVPEADFLRYGVNRGNGFPAGHTSPAVYNARNKYDSVLNELLSLMSDDDAVSIVKEELCSRRSLHPITKTIMTAQLAPSGHLFYPSPQSPSGRRFFASGVVLNCRRW